VQCSAVFGHGIWQYAKLMHQPKSPSWLENAVASAIAVTVKAVLGVVDNASMGDRKP
jgi:hypothetical protein